MKAELKKHEYISPTAVTVAEGRTFTDIPFSKEIFKEMKNYLSKNDLGDFKLLYDSSPVPYFEARYKLINLLVKQSGLKNILDIAAGFIPRGLELTKNRAIHCVEFDLPKITRQKQKIVKSILAKRGEQRSNLHLVSGNALNLRDLSSATAVLPPGPIAIVNEGLLRYLNRSEQQKLAKNIHAILSVRGGVWITPDIHLMDRLKRDKARLERTRVFAKLTKTTIEKNLFANRIAARKFFEDAGFAIREYRVTKIIPSLSSPKRLSLSEAKVLAALKKRMAFVLTPALFPPHRPA